MVHCHSGKLLYKYCDFTLQYFSCNLTFHFGDEVPREYYKIKNFQG